MATMKLSPSNVLRVVWFTTQLLASTVAQNSTEDHAVVQQNLEVAPPLPILQIGLDYILGQIGANATVQGNISHAKDVAGPNTYVYPRRAGFTPYVPLDKRVDGPIQCSASTPCADGSCCNSDGKCGFKAYNCKPTAPVTCLSNCGATAMCGIDSAGGSVKNVRNRACNRITPSQIKTTGLTHLNFAFATIDPVSFAVVPADPGDVALYTQFTALQSSSLKTWISIGGFDFSDVGPTHTTWSDMASTSANRAKFISSLVAFMAKYKFQGADLDWEYPASPERGGKPADTANLVSLVKEMRASFGTTYGLSSILAPDYWYLRGTDPKGMEPYVDWFGFMAYDLHGAWDANVPTLGSIIRPQTDLREITNDTVPLWFDKLTPSKVNLGLAYYGRGFTVPDPKCAYPGCAFSGPSKAAPCTNQAGVMSNRGKLIFQSARVLNLLIQRLEISQIIASKGLYVELLKDPAIKMISWDDQWIGFDDADTIALKTSFANSVCMGGTMIWSVDFDSGAGSGDTPSPPSNSTSASPSGPPKSTTSPSTSPSGPPTSTTSSRKTSGPTTSAPPKSTTSTPPKTSSGTVAPPKSTTALAPPP
ncbi:MAG: hypothetical protein M1812_006702 [Candelaria pacifica]|nr:MAG: hypothetical protein M1812_006702 [Candelaria pacifica]